MARETFYISIFSFLLYVGPLQAQSFWHSLENEIGLCKVDSLIVTNHQYYQMLDTIEHYWAECEIDRNLCYAVICFSDTNYFKVSVQQLAEIGSLVIKCYQNKINGAFWYRNHPYFVLTADSSLIGQNALQKSITTFTPPFFLSEIYDSLSLNSKFLIREEGTESGFTYPPTPFDQERGKEKYDNLELELILTGDKVVCRELESCLKRIER